MKTAFNAEHASATLQKAERLGKLSFGTVMATSVKMAGKRGVCLAGQANSESSGPKNGPSTTKCVVENKGDWKTSCNSVQEVFQSRRGENCPNPQIWLKLKPVFFEQPLSLPSRGKLPRARQTHLVQASLALENTRAFVSVNLRVYYYDE